MRLRKKLWAACEVRTCTVMAIRLHHGGNTTWQRYINVSKRNCCFTATHLLQCIGQRGDSTLMAKSATEMVSFFFFSAAFRLRLVASRRQHRRRVLPVQLSLLKMEFSGMDAAGITMPILRQLTRVHATCPAQGSTKRADIQCQTHLHDELGIKSRFIGDTRPYPIAQHTRGPNSLGARRI